jgi:hypothetical protein
MAEKVGLDLGAQRKEKRGADLGCRSKENMLPPMEDEEEAAHFALARGRCFIGLIIGRGLTN